jgi:hypothetical protein
LNLPTLAIHGLAEFAVVSAEHTYLCDGMGFAEAVRSDRGGLDRRADCS